MPLDPLDYTDPACPFCVSAWQKDPPVHAIPAARVLEKLDEHLARNDFPAAERHLLYWLTEAREGRDLRGEFLLTNELMGLWRKLGRSSDALAMSEAAMDLAEKLDILGEVSGATAMINRATVLKAFGQSADAVPLFERARAILEAVPNPDPFRLGSLYNNMALALVDVGRYADARELYGKALGVMARAEHGEGEMAVTWLNLANLVEAERGLEAGEAQIAECVERAAELLFGSGLPEDGNYAFVCEKCAPTFGYYGFWRFRKDAEEAAKRIYNK